MKLSKLDNIKIVMILSHREEFKVAKTDRSNLLKNCKGNVPISEDFIKSEKILHKMIAYLESPEKPKNNVPAIATSDEFDVKCDWDKKFLDIPEEEICEIMLAANYLDIPELLDLCAYKLATLFKTSALQSPF
jgi:hypothetical protein